MNQRQANCFQKNWDALTKHRKDFVQFIQPEFKKFQSSPLGTDAEAFQLTENDRGQTNLIYVREEPRVSGYYHQEDPAAEARQLLDQTDLSGALTVVFLGVGLGYLLTEFVKRRTQKNFAILIIEKNPQIFFRSLCAHDFSKLFEDTSIQWIVGSDIKSVRAQMNVFCETHATVTEGSKFIAHPAAYQTEQGFYMGVADWFFQARRYMATLGGNSINDQILGVNNALDNLEDALRNPGIFALSNQFEGQTCICLAAGPSANQHWDFLKKVQGKIPIIACDTLLKPMNAHGIAADFVTALERDDYVPILFRGIPMPERSTMVGPIMLMKETVDCCVGDKVFYCSHPPFLDLFGFGYLGKFPAMTSAGNLNIHLARVLGFKKVILIGQDLAFGYENRTTHVSGTIDPSREKSRTDEEMRTEANGSLVRTQDGTAKVHTKAEWDIFRISMQDQIADAVDMEFINTSPKGAYIDGTKLMSPEEAIEYLKPQEFDIYPIKRKLLQPISEKEYQERRAGVLRGIEKGIKTLENWIPKGKEVEQKLQKWKKKISDRELEGRGVSLEFLNQAIDEVLQIKVKATNDDLEFYQIGTTIIMPGHILFERELNGLQLHIKDEYRLKKLVLLAHQKYFELWSKFLPTVLERLKQVRSQPSLSDSVSPQVNAETQGPEINPQSLYSSDQREVSSS